MIPPFDTVVKSPPSGVEIKAQTLAPIASSRPNGSTATTGPTVRRAQAARARAGVNRAGKGECRGEDAVSTRNSLRIGLGMGSSHDIPIDPGQLKIDTLGLRLKLNPHPRTGRVSLLQGQTRTSTDGYGLVL